MRKFWYLILFLSLLLVVSNCSKSIKSEKASEGMIKIYLTDVPTVYDSVNIVVSEVLVHKADTSDTAGEWIVLSESTRVFNLLDLANGAMAVLDSGSLDAGHYTQIRLLITDGSCVVVDGQRYDLEIPSGYQTGVKLVHQFTIEENKLYELILDFDAERSIVHTGSDRYLLKPTIRVIAKVTSGEIVGVTVPFETEVFALANSDTVAYTIPDTSGYFKLVALPEDLYSVKVVPFDTMIYADTTISGINVLAEHTTDLDTIYLRVK